MELEQRFADDEACRQYLFGLRWPQGFECSACGGKGVWKGSRNRLLCTSCRRQIYILAGTVFQDSHLPLALWFRAMWHLTSQKNGISALGLQRELGIGSYKTAWTLLHKLRRAMVRPGRERLRGAVEVDEAYWGAPEEGAVGRLTEDKALIAVAVEEDRDGIGRIRLHRIPNLTRATLHDFIAQSIEPGSTVRTDGLPAYLDLAGYDHDRKVQRNQPEGEHLLPRAHRVISLFKRWLMGTHQGAVSHDHLDDYLNEFVFRFNRRKSASRGKLFFRLAQQAVQVAPAPYVTLITPQHVGDGGVK